VAEANEFRPRHSNHNGLVKAKNGAVIRKYIMQEAKQKLFAAFARNITKQQRLQHPAPLPPSGSFFNWKALQLNVRFAKYAVCSPF
jgi:hypothetical protein